jgi:hypothetical protein
LDTANSSSSLLRSSFLFALSSSASFRILYPSPLVLLSAERTAAGEMNSDEARVTKQNFIQNMDGRTWIGKHCGTAESTLKYSDWREYKTRANLDEGRLWRSIGL